MSVKNTNRNKRTPYSTGCQASRVAGSLLQHLLAVFRRYPVSSLTCRDLLKISVIKSLGIYFHYQTLLLQLVQIIDNRSTLERCAAQLQIPVQNCRRHCKLRFNERFEDQADTVLFGHIVRIVLGGHISIGFVGFSVFHEFIRTHVSTFATLCKNLSVPHSNSVLNGTIRSDEREIIRSEEATSAIRRQAARIPWTKHGTMQTNERSGEKDLAMNEAQTTQLNEARSLLTQALTRSSNGEHGEALDSIAAATQRLGKCPPNHPIGDVYANANEAQNRIYGGQFERARYHIREALQFLDTAREVEA